jgi:uracil-DNA glycosylase family 4
MPWRPGSVDDRQRYLKQQAELGGAEVVLSRKATELVTVAAAPVTVREVPQLQNTGQMPAAKRAPSTGEGRQVAAAPSEAHRPAQLEVTGAVPAAKKSSPKPEPLSTQHPAPSTKAALPPGSWRKGAPPVPGPGLVITPPVTFPELATLDAVAKVIAGCRNCPLCEGRTNTVPGEGPLDAKFVVVGEGPGATEDELGRPFVGKAGALLDSILGSVDIPRSSAFILNVVKCRPPSNRTPLPDEAAACLPYLHRQLAILRPKVILAAGGTAAASLLQSKLALGKLRGQVHRYGGIPVIATYHPAYLLRDPRHKKETWDDVRIARQLFDA